MKTIQFNGVVTRGGSMYDHDESLHVYMDLFDTGEKIDLINRIAEFFTTLPTGMNYKSLNIDYAVSGKEITDEDIRSINVSLKNNNISRIVSVGYGAEIQYGYYPGEQYLEHKTDFTIDLGHNKKEYIYTNIYCNMQTIEAVAINEITEIYKSENTPFLYFYIKITLS